MTGLLKEVDAQVAKIWGTEKVWQSGIPINADDAAYTRENIRHWILRWHELGQLASHSLKWARVLADIELAVNCLPESLHDFFEVYFVMGYSPEEVLIVMEWQRYKSFTNACSSIERKLCAHLLNRRIKRFAYVAKETAIPELLDMPTPISPRNMAV